MHYADEDQKSETVVYSYQVMEKILIWFEKKNLQCKTNVIELKNEKYYITS